MPRQQRVGVFRHVFEAEVLGHQGVAQHDDNDREGRHRGERRNYRAASQRRSSLRAPTIAAKAA